MAFIDKFGYMIDILAGDEVNFLGKLFVDHFHEARKAGWHITGHAGEEAGPDGIWQAIEELGAERIGHDVSVIQDPKHSWQGLFAAPSRRL